MSLFRFLNHTRVSVFVYERFLIIYVCVLRRGFVCTSPNPQASRPPLVGCPRLLIQYIRSYPPYWRPFLHSQPWEAPCCGVRTVLQCGIVPVTHHWFTPSQLRLLKCCSFTKRIEIVFAWFMLRHIEMLHNVQSNTAKFFFINVNQKGNMFRRFLKPPSSGLLADYGCKRKRRKMLPFWWTSIINNLAVLDWTLNIFYICLNLYTAGWLL
jgi:hypothetical protein